jgi:hypothetical protein
MLVPRGWSTCADVSVVVYGKQGLAVSITLTLMGTFPGKNLDQI